MELIGLRLYDLDLARGPDFVNIRTLTRVCFGGDRAAAVASSAYLQSLAGFMSAPWQLTGRPTAVAFASHDVRA